MKFKRSHRVESAVPTIAVLVALITSSGSSLASAREQYVFNRLDLLAATETIGVAVADFNGDGIIDLAVTEYGNGSSVVGNTVTIFLGQPNGTFVFAGSVVVGSEPTTILAADFNGDGKPDLAVLSVVESSVSILIGNGDGTFQPQQTYAVGTTSEALMATASNCQMVAGDFNGDGKLDLAVANGQASTISVLLGNGDGTFQPSAEFAAGQEPVAIAAADFNEDGKLDLVVVNGFKSPILAVLLGNGDGTFQAPMSVSAGFPATAVATGDLNGDGRADLAVLVSASSGTCLAVVLGNGDGTFQAPVDYSTGLQNSYTLVAADLTGSGKVDVVAAGSAGSFMGVSVLLGNGDGTFQNHVPYQTFGPPFGLAVADLNGDGKLDLAATDDFGDEVSILLGNGNGSFNSSSSYATGTGPLAVASGDFNNDGKPDLVVANSGDGTVSVYLNNGDGTFQPSGQFAAGQEPVAIAVGDFNGDGKLDLVVVNGFSSSTVSILLGNGDGTFQAPFTVSVGSPAIAIATGDFNGDGRADLAALVSTDSGICLAVLLGNGDGTFQAPITTPVVTGAFALALDDFNGDGKLDVAVADGSNPLITVLLGNGDGTFQSPVNYAASIEAFSITAGDLTGNGKLDLVGGNGTNSAVFIGNGDGTFQVPTATVFGNLVQVLADVNGDGKLDLVGTGQSGFAISFGNGDGTFQSPFAVGSLGLTLPVVGTVLAADFTGDGAQDLAALGTGTNSLYVLLDTPVIALAPRSFAFNVAVGETGPPQQLTATNVGVAPLTISSIAISGSFAETDNCEQTLAAGAACTVSVTYTPTTSATVTGTLTLVDNAPTSPQVISLTGTTSPLVAPSPASLSFAAQVVGTPSAAQTVTLTNTGSATLSITSIATTGDFTATNTCSGSVAAGASCTILVVFKPTAAGTRTGTLTITDNAPSSPQTIALMGTGTAPSVTLAPTSLSFGSELVGQSSPSSLNTVVQVTNSGSAPLTVTSITIAGTDAGDFSQQNNCGATVAADATCSVSVTFTPTAGGTRSATLTVADNAAGSPQTAALTGTGEDFSLTVVGSSSASVTPGQTASYQLSPSAVGGFDGTVSLACSGAPSASTCTVAPSSVALNSTLPTTQVIMVTVATTAGSTAPPRRPAPPFGTPQPRTWLWLISLAAVVVTVGLARVARRRVWVLAAALSVLVVVAAAMPACGGSSAPPAIPGTPPGTYTLTVTGTFTSGTVMLQNNVSLTLTVQ